MSICLRTAMRSADEIKEARAALNTKFREYKSIGELWADRDFVVTSAKLIRQLARDQFAKTDPTPLIFDSINGPGLGNWLQWEEYVNTAKVVERSIGGKITAFTPHKNVYGLALSDYRVDFSFELEQVLTGQMDINVWVDHMAEAISRHHIMTGLSVLDAAVVGNDHYGNLMRTVLVGDVTQPGLNAALRRLGDVNPDITILGRYTALFPITQWAGYSDTALEEFRQAGMIGSYAGAKIVVLRDGYNPFFQAPAVPANRIYLVGGAKGGVFAEDDVSALDYQEVDQKELRFDVGTKLRSTFRVYKPWRYHIIELN